MHDLADLRGGLALESEADDLSAMGEHRPEVVERAAHRDQDVGVRLAHHFQVTGDGPRRDEEDAIGEVFGGEQGSLTEGLLAEVEEPRLAEAGGPVLMKQQDRRLLPRWRVRQTVCFWQSATGFPAGSSAATATRVIFPGEGSDGLGGEEGEVDLFDDAENGFGLERRTVQSLLDLGGEAGIEGLGIQPLDDFAVAVANAHRLNLLNKCQTELPGQTYV